MHIKIGQHIRATEFLIVKIGAPNKVNLQPDDSISSRGLKLVNQWLDGSMQAHVYSTYPTPGALPAY